MIRYNGIRTRPLSIPSVLKVLIAGAAIATVAGIASVNDEAFGSNTEADIVDKGIDGVQHVSSGEIKTYLRNEAKHLSRSLEQTIHPDLPFGDINILVVSDVHSFVGGHPHEPDRNADYGDLFSFHERLEAHCEDTGNGDLFLFNNGDILHGTGLAMDGNATNLLPILNAMPWDSLTMGRQEATYSDVLRDMNDTLLPKFPGKYVTSNVVWADTKEPYGDRYQFLRGRNSTVLVVGFLYDTVSSSQTIEVASIEETIQQDWFRQVLRQNETDNDDERYDAIVVMAHMDNDNPVIDTIYDVIRSNVEPEMPIQFLTGHSHKRQRTNLMKRDRYVHRIEPGGVFDTIGWVTIPKYETARTLPPKSDELQEAFRQEFLNTSKAVLHARLGLADDQELRTDRGTAVSELIHETQERLGLNQIVACPGHDFFRNISIHDGNSLWKLWREHVVRTEIFQKDEDRVMLVSKSTFRYDLRGSGKHDAMTLDDVVAIAPYMERVVYVGDVPDWMIRRMNNTFNTFSHHNIIPDYVLAGDLDAYKTAESYRLYTHEVDVPKIKTKLEKFNFQDFVLEYTGQRDTLYWLDYVRTAFPCDGGEQQEPFRLPYFFDEKELEEESTDGTLALEDLGSGEGTVVEEEVDSDEDMTWTLPPGEGYQGYIPGKGTTEVVPVSVYENYKSKDEIDEEKKKAQAAKVAAARGSGTKSDLRSQHLTRKKTQRKIIKGFALTLAGLVLLVPVVCLVLQVLGKNNYYDDYDDDQDGVGGLYDLEEVQLLRRHRKRGTEPRTRGEGLRSAPFKEIEIS